MVYFTISFCFMLLGLIILNIRITVKYKSNNSSLIQTFLRNSISHPFFLESPIFLLISFLSPSTPYTKKWHTFPARHFAVESPSSLCKSYATSNPIRYELTPNFLAINVGKASSQAKGSMQLC